MNAAETRDEVTGTISRPPRRRSASLEVASPDPEPFGRLVEDGHATPHVPGNGRAPTIADAAVGRLIREKRRAAGKTQKQLAQLLGITNTQLHRYEVGATRVAASRLYRIAGALGVNVESLIAEQPALTAPPSTQDQKEVSDLVRAFHAIVSPKHRRALVSLARTMAAGDHGPDENAE